jgi:hypothetical protein
MNVQLALDFLASGSHERCNSPYCRKRFPFSDGKFQRVKGLDEQWYCDTKCGSAAYLVRSVHEETV